MEQSFLKKSYFSDLCQKKHEVEFNVDDIISRLLSLKEISEKDCDLKETEIKHLILQSRQLFLSESPLLELRPPLIIVGDIHGQLRDLFRWFDMCGYPSHSNYLFLGNYINRGVQSIETICLLLAYKIKFPEKIFLLRGNHECGNISFIYGFYDACVKKYGINLWKTFIGSLDCLPLAALINNTIFCVHGGISPVLYDFDQIRSISRPVKVPQEGLICDLLWSDPDNTFKNWSPDEFRAVSYSFGPKAVADFLMKHGLELICRAHQVVQDGYKFFSDRKLVTLFSAPNYRGELNNAGAVMIIDEHMMCSFKLLKPRKKNKAVRLLYKTIMQT